MYDLLINILTHPAIGIATFLIGVLLGNFFSIGRDRRQEFNKAAAIFRDAFLPELTFLKHNAIVADTGSSTNLSEFLHYGYTHRHLKALETFKDYLTTQERVDINKAWKQYCHNQDNPELLFFEQYSTGSTSKKETDSKKALALKQIEEILKFAKHK